MSARRIVSELDDLSLDTTFPTDPSLSADEISDLQTTTEDPDSRLRLRGSRRAGPGTAGPGASFGGGRDGGGQCRSFKCELRRKELELQMDSLNAKLAEKMLLVDNMKAQHVQKVDELEDRLGKLDHENSLLQAKFDAQIHLSHSNERQKQAKLEKEINEIRNRTQELEKTNERLQENAVDIRHSLDDLELTENQYFQLKSFDADSLSLKDVVAMRLFENKQVWRAESNSQRMKINDLTDDLKMCRSSLERCNSELEDERMKRSDLDTRFQRLTMAYADLKDQVQIGNFKVDNFDKVQREHGQFEMELSDLRRIHSLLEAAHQSATRERDDMSIELASSKQTVVLLQQDKTFFSKQVSELSNKLIYADDRVAQLNEQLEKAKLSREELYEKYISSREQYKSEYEEKLKRQLEDFRIRSEAEIDRLKTSTRELYERENRMLREARDNAVSEKERALATEKETYTKYEQLLYDFRQQQHSHDIKISEAYNELKIKTAESQQTQILYDETIRNLQESQRSAEKTQKKLELSTKEYYSLQTSMEKRVSELEVAINEKTVKLEAYEKLEQELDEVIMQAADVENEQEAERVLFSYGYGANVPTTAKRRLKQSVHLARRVLELERANTSVRKEFDREKEKAQQLSNELQSTNRLLDDSHQPYRHLVESIRQRDLQINKLKQQTATLEADLKRTEKERSDLMRSKNQLTLDLERLLNHREEMAVMKQVVLNLGQSQADLVAPSSARQTPSSSKAGTVKSAGLGRTAQPKAYVFEAAEKDENVHRPLPTAFTVHKSPERKLKQKVLVARQQKR